MNTLNFELFPSNDVSENTVEFKGRFANIDADKLRGGYYTTPELASWLSSWAITRKDQLILEPSCGDGAFLEAAIDRLFELKADKKNIIQQLTGVEFNTTEALKSSNRVEKKLDTTDSSIVKNSDFFEWWKNNNDKDIDVVVGNPPFIRYQTFPEPHRSLAMEIMQSQGLAPNKLTNIWVPFVVAATALLKPGGRLALVLPAEILQVTYATQLRSFLTERFKEIEIIACNELFFENAEQEVILLLADGALPKNTKNDDCQVSLIDAHSVNEIISTKPDIFLKRREPKTVKHENEKWLKYFLSNKQISLMRNLRDAKICTHLGEHAQVNVGVVTGKNEFFVLSEEQVFELGISAYVTPLVSRSTQLKGSIVNIKDLEELASKGHRVFLLDINKERANVISEELLKYINFGEEKLHHKGYKCSIRTPWYQVPSIWIPDGFFFRQIYDFPRIVLNETQATATDTIHRFKSKGADPKLIIENTYSWLTAASAEIEGRSYGGGVLELEPKEAERILIPKNLAEALPIQEVDKLVRAGKLNTVLEENSRLILEKSLGLSKDDCNMLKEIWIRMRDRRNTRKRSKA
ncbi:N-6 DNA methylase [Acinetobacter sp. A1-4-2]|uniref:site-specific DNA-methyltransferase (adenine-specific) n=1 Tax=Acinetobacter sp. A1-4-2 TaxID=3156489 RepID=A0AAU7SY38_9GAMM